MNVAVALLVTRLFALPPAASETYDLTLVRMYETVPAEHIFVVGNSGFRTVEALKRFIAVLPPGTTIRWAPGCERIGDEPLLSSPKEMSAFVEFCRRRGIKFVMVPSG